MTESQSPGTCFLQTSRGVLVPYIPGDTSLGEGDPRTTCYSPDQAETAAAKL